MLTRWYNPYGRTFNHYGRTGRRAGGLRYGPRGGIDIGHALATLDEVRRQFDEIFSEPESSTGSLGSSSYFGGTWPNASVYDTGDEFVVLAELPGVADDDLELSVTQDGLTVSGERKIETPEGASIHRQERMPISFSRSFSFHAPIDPDAATANLENGLLTITLPKAAEAKPRRLQIGRS